MNESRKDRFDRLAEKRTNSVLNNLRLLGNLSNKSNYDYSEAEIRKIFSAIDNRLREVKLKFTSNRNEFFRLR